MAKLSNKSRTAPVAPAAQVPAADGTVPVTHNQPTTTVVEAAANVAASIAAEPPKRRDAHSFAAKAAAHPTLAKELSRAANAREDVKAGPIVLSQIFGQIWTMAEIYQKPVPGTTHDKNHKTRKVIPSGEAPDWYKVPQSTAKGTKLVDVSYWNDVADDLGEGPAIREALAEIAKGDFGKFSKMNAKGRYDEQTRLEGRRNTIRTNTRNAIRFLRQLDYATANLPKVRFTITKKTDEHGVERPTGAMGMFDVSAGDGTFDPDHGWAAITWQQFLAYDLPKAKAAGGTFQNVQETVTRNNGQDAGQGATPQTAAQIMAEARIVNPEMFGGTASMIGHFFEQNGYSTTQAHILSLKKANTAEYREYVKNLYNGLAKVQAMLEGYLTAEFNAVVAAELAESQAKANTPAPAAAS